jgi:copper transport protein
MLSLALLPAGAHAHATLEESTPARGATLDAAPREIAMRFSEPVEVAFGAIQVYDAAGERVRSGGAFHPPGQENAVAARLAAGLGDGSYTVTYRVISADSHPISGGFTFSVGEGSGASKTVDELLAGSGAGPITTTALAAARAVQYAATAIALGGLLFLVFCWPPTIRAPAVFVGRLRALLRLAAAAGVASAATGIALQGAIAAGTSLWDALDGNTLDGVLATRFGTWWAVGLGAWVAAGLLGTRRAALAPLAVVALVPAFSGHAGTESPLAFWVGLNFVHVVAVSAWIGGVAVLAGALRSATAALEGAERTRLLTAVVGRFSTLAGALVAIVLLTGVIQSLAAIDSLDQLPATAYGRAVLIKLVLFLALLSAGYVNRNRILPRLHRADGAPGATGALLRRVLRTELAVGILVLAVTGALAGYQPSDTVAAGPFSGSAPLGPARLEMTVDPARVGANELHVYLFDRASGAQWDDPKELRLQASLPEKGVEAISIDARKAGPGHYVAGAAPFVPAGEWRITVIARVSDFDEFRAELAIPIEK